MEIKTDEKKADLKPAGEKKPTSMVAPKSKAQEQLQPVEELAAERGMPGHAFAGMCRANGWADGKQLTPTVFETAMTAYIRRPMGLKPSAHNRDKKEHL